MVQTKVTGAHCTKRSQKVKKGAVKKVADKPIGLFQLCFPDTPSAQLDPDMTTIALPATATALSHAQCIKRLLADEKTSTLSLWGLLPADYPSRMGMNAAAICNAIREQSGADVYILSPHVELEALYQNLWVQGDVSHPNLMTLCNDVFRKTSIDTSVLMQLIPSDRMVTGFGVIATTAFWRDWLRYVADFLKRTEALPDPLKTLLYHGNADPKGLHHSGTYLRFVIERLMGDFILSQEPKLHVKRLVSPILEDRLNPYLRDLRTLRDLAITSGSVELTGIWASYRKLYLAGAYGKAWLDQHGPLFDMPVRLKNRESSS